MNNPRSLRRAKRENSFVKLRQSKGLLAKAELIGDLGSWEHNVLTGENVWSANLCRLLGVDPTKTKLSEELFWELVHPDDREAVRTAIEYGMKDKHEYEYQARFILPGGCERVFYTRGKPILGPNNQIIKRMGVTQDITVRVEAERALLESEGRYRDLVESRHDLFCTHDLSGRILSVNELPARLLGYCPEELIGRYIPDQLYDLNKTQFRDYLERIKRNGFDSGLMALLTKSGEKRIWKYQNILRTMGVSAPLVRGMAHDVTEQINAQKALRESSARLQRYLDIAEVILLALDLKGRIILINRKGCSILGWNESELIGRDWIETCLPIEIRDSLELLFENLLAGDFSYVENLVLTKSGETRLIGWRNSLLLDEKGSIVGTLSSGEDITERKKAESAVRQLSARLLLVQDHERRILAQELHDGFGTYLSGLSLALGKIRTFIDETDIEQRQVITESRKLIQAACREMRTISYLLHPPMLEISGLESALAWLIRGFSSRSGIKVSLETPAPVGRLRPEIELTLFRIAQEALNNVYRHSESKSASVRLFRKSLNIVLEIADPGKGMKPRFLEGTPTATVGISSMRERVQDLGGTFTIESAKNKGCLVRATILSDDKPYEKEGATGA